MARYLGIDYGDVRIGLAQADEAVGIAHPREVIENKAGVVERIGRIIAEDKFTEVVVGLPVNMDGTEGFQARAAREFGQELSDVADVRIDYCDERLSSKQASAIVREASGRRGDKCYADAHQAAVILQSYIDNLKGSEDWES